jgi:hypothetical protein
MIFLLEDQEQTQFMSSGIMKNPSILIPIPWTRENEQQKNAELLEK